MLDLTFGICVSSLDPVSVSLGQSLNLSDAWSSGVLSLWGLLRASCCHHWEGSICLKLPPDFASIWCWSTLFPDMFHSPLPVNPPSQLFHVLYEY